MHDNVVQYAKSVGLEYNFDRALVTNSMKGHRIIQMAKTRGLGDEAEECLFRAYFTDGKNLNDIQTLVDLGKEIGLNEGEVNEALTNPIYIEKVENDSKEGEMLGLTGVPFFVVDRKYVIVGAQLPAVILQTLEMT
jgi:protein disulfide-isomerase